MKQRSRWRDTASVLGAALGIGALEVGHPAARAGEGEPTGPQPPAVVRYRNRAKELSDELAAGASMVGWLRDPAAVAEGKPLRDWLALLASKEPAESSGSRRLFLALGSESLPWIGIGLGGRAGTGLREACAALAADLVGAAGVDLKGAITDPRPWMRRVAWAAARRGGVSEEARRVALGDDDAVVGREAAVGFLREIPTGVDTIAALDAALAAEDFDARAVAGLALLRTGSSAATRFATSLERPEVRKRFSPIWMLGMPAEAADAVLPLFGSPSWHVRSHAVTSLALATTLSDGAVRALAKALEDASGDVRWRAACALDRAEARGTEAALRARLSDAVPDVRTAAAVALANLGVIDEHGLAPLVAALLATPESSSTSDMLALYSEVVGPCWYLLFAAPMPAGRVAEALGRHGASGVVALREAAREAGVSGRRLALLAYSAAGAAGTEALLSGLGDADEGVRRAAAIALARRGDGRIEVVEALARQVRWDPTTNGHGERMDALLALRAAALPGIRALLAKRDAELDPGLLAALIELGEGAAPAVPEVLLLHPHGEHILPGEGSSSAIFERVIRSIGAAGVPGLIAALRSDDPTTRERAFAACLLLGPVAKPALPAIREALTAKRIPGYEDASATEAIQRIEK